MHRLIKVSCVAAIMLLSKAGVSQSPMAVNILQNFSKVDSLFAVAPNRMHSDILDSLRQIGEKYYSNITVTLVLDSATTAQSFEFNILQGTQSLYTFTKTLADNSYVGNAGRDETIFRFDLGVWELPYDIKEMRIETKNPYGVTLENKSQLF